MPLGDLLKESAFDDVASRRLTMAFDQVWAKVVASHAPIAENSDA